MFAKTIYKFNGFRSKPFPSLLKTEKKKKNFYWPINLKLNFVRQFIHPIINSEIVFKLFTYQEWLTSSSWMGDDCALSSPVIPHPPFHPHHHNNYFSLLGDLPVFGIGWVQPWQKNSKIQKKICNSTVCSCELFVNYFYMLCTLICTKFWKTNIVFEYFSAFKINKSHCSSEF